MDSLSLSTSSSKRVKLPKKFFDDDYNRVDHSCVPRKLRSAIKKRACESVSPPLPYPRKLGYTVQNRLEVEAKDCTKKFNSCMHEDSTGSPEEAIVGPITKEEEEVAETLYALAGMFPNHDKANNSIILKENPSETAPKDEECRSIRQAISSEAADGTPKFERPPGETKKMLTETKQLLKEVDNSVPLVNFPTIFTFPKDDSAIERPSCKAITKLPPWLVNATCATQPCSPENAGLSEKDSTIIADRKKSWKTCTAHVYISHLIRDLKLPKGRELPIQIKPDEGSKQEAPPETNNLRMVTNGSAEKKSSNEVRNAIRLHKRLLQDQQLACTTSEMYTSHKQNFDVFSNSGGSCGVEASNVVNRYGKRAELTTRFHYLNSPVQEDHMIIPQMLPFNSYSSTWYPDHLSAAASQQMQLPPYYGMPFSGPPYMTAATVLPKQQLWSTQGGQPRYCPSEVSAAHLYSWQNRRHESPAPSQTVLPNSSRSKYGPSSLLEAFAPKYGQSAPQKQQFAPNTSLLAPKRRAPLGYEENGGLYFPNNASSLQVLCNERL